MAARFTYKFPKSLGGITIVAREIPVGEQMNVSDALSGTKLVHELAARMLVEVDGKRIDAENRDEVWATFNAKQRDMIFKLYRHLHVSTEEEANSFFGTESVAASEG